MKFNRIYFNKPLKGRALAMYIVFALLFLFGMFYNASAEEKNLLLQIFIVLGWFGIIIVQLRPFFYKNYISFTKNTVLIKINTFSWDVISFKHIKEVNLEKDVLQILKAGNELKKYPVANIQESDVYKLISEIKFKINHD